MKRGSESSSGLNGRASQEAADQMGIARALPTGSNREWQCVGVVGPTVGFQIGVGAHARRARHHVGIAVWNHGNVAFPSLTGSNALSPTSDIQQVPRVTT
jgi:hypothetical protein